MKARGHVGMLMAMAFCLLAGTACAQFTQSDCMRAALDKHNELRARHGAPPLEWDEALVAREKVWVTKMAQERQCGRLGQITHSPGPENLWAYWGPRATADSCRAAVEWFYSEIEFYKWTNTPQTDSLRSLPAGKAIGHFTQVVWSGARRVGCYFSEGPNCVMVGCAYDQGNTGDDKWTFQNVKPSGTPVQANPPTPTKDQDSQYCSMIKPMGWCDGYFFDTGKGAPAQQTCPQTCAAGIAAQRKKWMDEAAAMDGTTLPSTPSTPSTPSAPTESNPSTPSDPSTPSTESNPSTKSSGGDCMRVVIAKVNELRARHGAPPLEWDDALAAREKVWTTRMATERRCGRSQAITSGPGGPESLYAWWGSSSDSEGCAAAVDWFYSQISGYTFSGRPYTDSAARGSQFLSFSQLVWRGATKIGCHKADGDNCFVMGCAYDQGNAPTDQFHLENVKPAGTPVQRNPAPATKDKYAHCDFIRQSGWCLGGAYDSGTGELLAAACPESCASVIRAQRKQWMDAAAALDGATASSRRKMARRM